MSVESAARRLLADVNGQVWVETLLADAAELERELNGPRMRGDYVALADAFFALADDAARDVQRARSLANNPPEAAVAWDRAANSLRVLVAYCEQHAEDARRRVLADRAEP